MANQCAQKIQELAVKEERNHPGITLVQLESAIGMDLVGQMSMAVNGLGMRLSRDEAVYLKAFSVLRAALNAELNSGWVAKFRNVWSPKGGVTLVKLREANPKFRIEALPPLPKALADAVADVLED